MATKRTDGGIFGWCTSGQHNKCRRAYRRYVNEKNKLVWLDEVVVCQCTKRSCNCYKTKNNKPIDDLEPL